jgi:hypothetical protein
MSDDDFALLALIEAWGTLSPARRKMIIAIIRG